jgi:hypothetical protein
MLAALTLLIAAGVPAPSGPAVVALMPLRSLGVPADVVNALAITLRNELSQLPEARLAPEKELLAALKAEPDCEAKIACASAAALKVGARELISGTTSQLGDTFTVDLKLVEARTAEEVRRVTYPVSGSQDALIEMLREAAVRLLAPARYVGALRIEVPGASGAELFLDGKSAGRLPLATPIEGLPPGQHTVRVADAQAREMSTFVQVRFAQTTEARIDLSGTGLKVAVPSAALSDAATAYPGRPGWVRPVAIAGLGAGLLSTAFAVVFHVKAYSTANDLNQKEARNELQPGSLGLYGDVDRNTRIARALYVTGALFAAAGGGLLYWDLHGASLHGSF